MVKCFGCRAQHDINRASKNQANGSKLVGISLVEKDLGKIVVTQSDVPNRENGMEGDTGEDEDVKFCCLSGCLTTIFAAVLFFVALPTGILLCVYASYNPDRELLIVGIVLAISPLVSLPLVVVVLHNRRKIRRVRKRKVSAASADNNNNNNKGTKF